ncbi:hypothetical protein ACFQZC_01660 [Streptacidiphilus monticola]
MSREFDALLSGTRIIPVITLHSAASAEPLAQALSDGGIRCAEVTLRTPLRGRPARHGRAPGSGGGRGHGA